MDWQMPGLDGVDATRRIRSLEAGGTRVAILGMTASAQTADRRACLAAGMDEVLIKPVSLDQLGAALANFAPIVPAATGDGVELGALDRLASELGTTAPVRSIVTTYLRELDSRRSDIATALAAGDEELLHRTAHTLRATSRTLGAEMIDTLARRLETSPFPPSDDLVAELETAAEVTITGLEGWIRRNAG